MTSVSAMAPTVGTVGPAQSFGPITRTDIVRYAGASGDFNPIHHDQTYAVDAGFPTVFSIGMFQAGLLSTYVTNWLGAANLRRFAVRFKEQVWPDDMLTCSGTVTQVDPTASGVMVEVELTCTRQTGGQAVMGSATFLLAEG